MKLLFLEKVCARAGLESAQRLCVRCGHARTGVENLLIFLTKISEQLFWMNEIHKHCVSGPCPTNLIPRTHKYSERATTSVFYGLTFRRP